MSPDYAGKRSFDQTPEPPSAVAGDVDPVRAIPGHSFVIHQHHARRLHFDLRLEMLNGETPVLVSWAVPKNLPLRPKERALAIHVEDHPFEYGSFSGTIPAGNYGAGEVRVFDSGTYEMVDQKGGKLTFRLYGRRLRGVWHLVQTSRDAKDNWLAILKEWEGDEPDALPPLRPMLASTASEVFNDPEWAFEPLWRGTRALARCDRQTTRLSDSSSKEIAAEGPLAKIQDRLVALDALLDGVIAKLGANPYYVAFDLLYLDGRSLVDQPFSQRRATLEELLVPSDYLQLSPSAPENGVAILDAAVEHGLEGVVAKRQSSHYLPGKLSEDWLKIVKS